MLFKICISLLCFLVPLVNACEPEPGAGQNPAPPDQARTKGDAESQFDACALVLKSEIASVQGAEVQQAQPTMQKNGHLDISQCYYTAVSADGTKNLSVYLQVIQLNPQSSERNALKEFWEERFRRASKEKGREESEEREEAGGEEEEEAINPPVRVSGIGDEAYWLGSSRGGALYVLKKKKVLRVTVGADGADAEAQIKKSKTLAKKALARLT